MSCPVRGRAVGCGHNASADLGRGRGGASSATNKWAAPAGGTQFNPRPRQLPATAAAAAVKVTAGRKHAGTPQGAHSTRAEDKASCAVRVGSLAAAARSHPQLLHALVLVRGHERLVCAADLLEGLLRLVAVICVSVGRGWGCRAWRGGRVAKVLHAPRSRSPSPRRPPPPPLQPTHPPTHLPHHTHGGSCRGAT